MARGTFSLRRQEEARQRMAEQNRTMELARAQAEQAARYADLSEADLSEADLSETAPEEKS
jgi:uncharacterized protein YjbI with pentapeptide repeats